MDGQSLSDCSEIEHLSSRRERYSSTPAGGVIHRQRWMSAEQAEPTAAGKPDTPCTHTLHRYQILHTHIKLPVHAEIGQSQTKLDVVKIGENRYIFV